jgi:glutathione dehydrogenase/transferase
MLPASARMVTCATTSSSSSSSSAFARRTGPLVPLAASARPVAARRAAAAASSRAKKTTTTMASSDGNTLTLHVKGDPASKKLGDCPFCHRVLLTVACKGVPYSPSYIDLDDKPEWLVEKAQGKVPVLERAGFWLPDSDEIVKFLEREFPVPSMAAYDDHGGVGTKLFPAFRGAILAEKGSDEEKQKLAELGAELDRADAYLGGAREGGKGGPFLGGDKLDAADASFAPKLYHAKVALPALKGVPPLFGEGAPRERPALARYWAALTALDAWRQTDYGEAAILAGWERHVRMHK